MDLGRRSFLKMTLASAAAVKVGDGGNQLGNVLQATATEERVPDGVEKYVLTTCDLCPGGCGARVRLIDTRAVKLEGNPLHPVTRGGLCPMGQASLQALYSPDRVSTPLRRFGSRGSGQWQAVSWDEAMTELASRLGALRASGRPEALALVVGRPDGAVADLFRRFALVFGTPHVLESPPPDASALALWAMQGIRRPAAYDLENAKYILSFGVPLLEGWWSPVRQMRALAQARQGTPGRRGKLVQFEPRLSLTAAKADEWVPVVPGTEGALALGVANVLVSEGRYDRDFVAARTSGFEDWTDESGSHAGFRSLLLKEYSPAAVAAITGVPADTIHRIALEFAAFGPGIAIGPAAGTGATLEAAMAVHALNGLVGSIERTGGVLLAPDSPTRLPEPAVDGLAKRSVEEAMAGAGPAAASVADLLQAPARQRPAALLVWGADPAFTGPDPRAMRHALEAIPFVVSIASFLDDTAARADLVLPEHLFLEGWQEAPSSPGLPYSVVSVSQPAVIARHSSRHAGDILLELARRLGGSVAGAFPWKDYSEVLPARAAGLQAAAGSAFGAQADKSKAPADAATGDAAAKGPSFDDFWSDLLAKGGWVATPALHPDWARVIRTPSGRFEFYSRTLREAVRASRRPAELLAGLGLNPADDRLYMPHWSPRELGDPASFPLRLHTFSTLALGDGGGANQPFLQEIIAPHVSVTWDSWAELNPATAARLGVRDGDAVWVESSAGRVRVRARLYAGVMPDVVAVVLGQGHEQLGRYARGRGANAAMLLPATRQPLTGAPLYQPRVRVYAA